MATWKEDNLLKDNSISYVDTLRNELGEKYGLEPKKVNCGRCKYFGYNDGKDMTYTGNSKCYLRKENTNKLSVCKRFEPVDDTVQNMIGKTIDFDVFIKRRYDNLYVHCSGNLVSTIPVEGKGYKVKVTNVLDKDTPDNIVLKLLRASFVYVSKTEIEECAKIV